MRHLLPTARPILEDLAGTLAFYLLYLATGSARLAAGVGLAIGMGQIAAHLCRRRPIPTLLLMGVALTVVLGTLTLFTADPRFVLLKPSIAYACVAATMLPRGWVARYVPEIGRRLLPARTLDRVGWGWAALLFGTALLNVALVATVPPRAAALLFALWAAASKLALFTGQYVVLRSRAHRTYLAGLTPHRSPRP